MSRETSPLRDRVLFVVGARRSGTNWLQRILCAHPDVVGVPSESFLFARGIAPLTERFQHTAATSPTTGFVYMEREGMADALRDLCDAVLVGLREALRPEATWVVERTPDHVRFLPLIGQIYPDARVLHIIRDGRDVVRSLVSHEWGPSSVREASEQWRSAVADGRTAGTQLQHYREVRYEKLLDEPEDEIRRLFAWLNLRTDDEIVTLALAEARAAFNVDPNAPTVAAGKWRSVFSPADVKAFDDVAGALLRELGYETVEAGIAPQPRSPARAPSRGARAGRLATVVDRVASRVRRLRHHDNVNTATLVQYVAERFLACVMEGRFDDAVGMLRPVALVRLIDEAGEWRGRGEPARRRLIEALISDGALAGRVIRSDVHPAIPLVTTFLSLKGDDGDVHHRVIIVGADGRAVTHVILYRLD